MRQAKLQKHAHVCRRNTKGMLVSKRLGGSATTPEKAKKLAHYFAHGCHTPSSNLLDPCSIDL